MEGGGKEGSGDSKKDDKAKPRKHKVRPSFSYLIDIWTKKIEREVQPWTVYTRVQICVSPGPRDYLCACSRDSRCEPQCLPRSQLLPRKHSVSCFESTVLLIVWELLSAQSALGSVLAFFWLLKKETKKAVFAHMPDLH